jgi:hypothetical protein
MAEKCDPKLVAPVVAWLAHDSCQLTGETFSVAGGSISRVFVGHTPGILDPALSPEGVRDRTNEIVSEAGYRVFGTAQDEVDYFKRLLG